MEESRVRNKAHLHFAMSYVDNVTMSFQATVDP